MPMVRKPILEGKVAIITGAVSGIGKGVASRLIKEVSDNSRYVNTDMTIECKL